MNSVLPPRRAVQFGVNRASVCPGQRVRCVLCEGLAACVRMSGRVCVRAYVRAWTSREYVG